MTKTTKQKIFEKLNSWCYKLLTFLQLREEDYCYDVLTSFVWDRNTKIPFILLFANINGNSNPHKNDRVNETLGSSPMECMSDGNQDQLIKNLNKNCIKIKN